MKVLRGAGEGFHRGEKEGEETVELVIADEGGLQQGR